MCVIIHGCYMFVLMLDCKLSFIVGWVGCDMGGLYWLYFVLVLVCCTIVGWLGWLYLSGLPWWGLWVVCGVGIGFRILFGVGTVVYYLYYDWWCVLVLLVVYVGGCIVMGVGDCCRCVMSCVGVVVIARCAGVWCGVCCVGVDGSSCG